MGLDRPRKREKNFSPKFRSSRHRHKNSKKNSKKIQKIKNSLSGIIFSQNGMRLAEKEKKKILVLNSVNTWPGQENSEKNSKKIEKIKKPLSGIIFSQSGMR